MRRSHSGFSLLEILVAFVLLALALGILMRIFGTSASTASRIREEAQLYAVAQALIANVGIDQSIATTHQRGEGPGVVDWSLNIAPEGNSLIPPTPSSAESLVLWSIEATVSLHSQPERKVTLRTLRVSNAKKQ